jgi:hypothetical protein
MMTKRRLAILVITGSAAVLAVACRDSLAPSTTPDKDPFASHPQLLRSSAGPSRNGSILLTPQGGDYLLGGFLLHVPAGAVCDPSVTSYGPAFWDDTCTPITAPIRLQVEVSQKNGRLWIDFKPNVRFAPSANPDNWVTLTTWRTRGELTSALHARNMRQYALLYAPEIGSTPIDEGRIDASMITVVRMRDGLIWRRLKHFSGFTISLGRVCDPAVDPSCTVVTTTGGDVDVQPAPSQSPSGGPITTPDSTITLPDSTATAPDSTATAPDSTATAPDSTVTTVNQ